jgi:hypothetical protein
MMKVGKRVKNISSGYRIERGENAGKDVELGTITKLYDSGTADIHWDGCSGPYCVFCYQFEPYGEVIE